MLQLGRTGRWNEATENLAGGAHPHRSLSRKGFILVMSLIAAINLVVGGMFYAIGAWPVVGFLGLDVLLIWWAFRVNFADARKVERIVITEHELILDRLSERQAAASSSASCAAGSGGPGGRPERELIGSLYLWSPARPHRHRRLPAARRAQGLRRPLQPALAIPHI